MPAKLLPRWLALVLCVTGLLGCESCRPERPRPEVAAVPVTEPRVEQAPLLPAPLAIAPEVDPPPGTGALELAPELPAQHNAERARGTGASKAALPAPRAERTVASTTTLAAPPPREPAPATSSSEQELIGSYAARCRAVAEEIDRFLAAQGGGQP